MDAEIEEIENKIFGRRNTSHMAPRTPRPIVTVDVKKKTWEQPTPLHNRWHPEIPPVGEVKEGGTVPCGNCGLDWWSDS
jgi:hypothetical protein